MAAPPTRSCQPVAARRLVGRGTASSGRRRRRTRRWRRPPRGRRWRRCRRRAAPRPGHAGGRDRADDEVESAWTAARRQPCHDGDEERLQSTGGSRDTAGQPIDRDDEQREEQREVERREGDGVQPLTTPWPPPRHHRPGEDEHQTGREHPDRGHEQWPASRQELGDRDVRRAPRDRSEHGAESRPRGRSDAFMFIILISRY